MNLPNVTALRFADRLRDLTKDVDVILSDVWGVIHDGVKGFPPACQALQSFREQGGTVIMITNAPRPADSVQRQLRKMDISDETYDAIVSSGDLTRNYVASHLGQSFFMIGPERDNPMLRGLDVKLTTLEKADTIVCTGPFDDEVETEEDYREMMQDARKRNLTFICANPDIVVERGHRLVGRDERLLERQRDLQRPVEEERILLGDAVLAHLAHAGGHLLRHLRRVADDDAIALGSGFAEGELQESIDLFEIRGKLFWFGRGEFDELKSIGPNRILEQIGHGVSS